MHVYKCLHDSITQSHVFVGVLSSIDTAVILICLYTSTYNGVINSFPIDTLQINCLWKYVYIESNTLMTCVVMIIKQFQHII